MWKRCLGNIGTEVNGNLVRSERREEVGGWGRVWAEGRGGALYSGQILRVRTVRQAAGKLLRFRQNCLSCCSVKTRPRNKRFRVSKCRQMSDCVAFDMSAGCQGDQWICGLSSDLLFPTFHSVTCVHSTCAGVLLQPPDWPSLIKQVDKLLQM